MTEKILTAEGADRFEEFWAVYPRHDAKAGAKVIWDRCVIKMKLDPETIIAGAQRYALEKRGSERKFIAMGSTWLNQQRWTDEAGAPQASDTPARPRDTKALGVITDTFRAMEIRKNLLERTRVAVWSKIEDAALRLGCSDHELWGCLSPELAKRAWLMAVNDAQGGTPSPKAIAIEREDWIGAKDRYETRARHMRGMRDQRWSPTQQPPTIRVNKEIANARHDDDAPGHPGPEAGDMARAPKIGDRGIGREHDHERGPGQDPAPVGDQDGDVPAGLT